MRYAIIGTTVEQAEGIGATDVKEAHSAKIIFATLTEAQVAELRAVGCQVTLVSKVQATVTPPTPVAAAPTYSPEQLVWAAGLEEFRQLTHPPLYGEGLSLAIIDTGIRETHEKIKGRVVYQKNYTSDPMRDGFDHGTGVCSIALAVAPLCNILDLKVLDDRGEGTEEGVVLAIDDCIDLHDTQPDIAPWVINLSLGSPDDGNPNNPLRVACRAAIDRGIWVIAAVGNGGAPGTITSPASERYVFAVGSAKYEPFIVSDFSSRGPTAEGLTKPDAIMFGEDIITAGSASDTATIAKSGTSFATPFCSGMAVCSHEGWFRQAEISQPITGIYPGTPLVSPQQVVDVYLSGICVKPQGVPAGKDNSYGYGLPFGPLVAQAVRLVPAVDISTILMPIVMIGMLGMIIKRM